MSDCIFCKIVAGQVPNHTVYEEQNFLAFLDIFPHSQGHTIVIPKIHKDNFFALTESEARDWIIVAKKTMEKIKAVLNPSGFNVGWNENPVAGQVVPHLHFHIMPRYEGDGGGSMHTIMKNPGDVSVAELAKKFII